jgi:hypothetical protein
MSADKCSDERPHRIAFKYQPDGVTEREGGGLCEWALARKLDDELQRMLSTPEGQRKLLDEITRIVSDAVIATQNNEVSG